MSPKRKKIRVEEVNVDVDHKYVKNQIKFEASTCIDCSNYDEWLVCEVCLGPKNPVGPVVLLPPKESREERKKRFKKYYKDRTKKNHLKKTKKEIKQGKQSTLASFLGLKKVRCCLFSWLFVVVCSSSSSFVCRRFVCRRCLFVVAPVG